MNFAWTIVVLVIFLAIPWRFLGSYMVSVYEGRVRWLVLAERPIYRVHALVHPPGPRGIEVPRRRRCVPDLDPDAGKVDLHEDQVPGVVPVVGRAPGRVRPQVLQQARVPGERGVEVDVVQRPPAAVRERGEPADHLVRAMPAVQGSGHPR
jgi:hypothetical protein